MKKKALMVLCLIGAMIFSSVTIYADQKDSRKMIKESLTEKAVPAVAETALESAASAEKVIRERKVQVRREKKERYLQGLSAYIRHVNRNVAVQEAETMAKSFVKYAKRYGVDEKVVMAVAQNESTYYSDAVSCADFKGLMQTGDYLAEDAGYDPGQLFDPEISIKVGAKYLGDKMKEFGDTRLALTAYNQGSGSVHSGNYTTGYADLAMERAEAVEDFLSGNGYQ